MRRPNQIGVMRKKILLVEDNAELVELWRIRVEAEGFDVVTAGNGVKALKRARALEPDLIVLDLVLPEMDGFALCERIRWDRRFHDTPIIVVTGLSSDLARFAGLEAGADEFVRKPVTPDELVSRIRYWLKEGRRRKQELPGDGTRSSPAWAGLR